MMRNYNLMVFILIGCMFLSILGGGVALATFMQADQTISGCQFLSSPSATPAFCDTFDAPAGTGNRSGDLNGTVWGVSRMTSNQNIGQGVADGWYPSTLNLCGTSVAVQPEQDVRICDGHVAESVNDGSTVTDLAMYPKQPFDIAGRTGTVVFDVSNDTQGGHAAWPEFWYTDQPAPAPFEEVSGESPAPRNGIGIQLFLVCGASDTAPDWGVSGAIIARNYQTANSFLHEPGAPSVNRTGCVSKAAASANTLNHVELSIAPSGHIVVYATDAYPIGGTVPLLKQIAIIDVAGGLPLTRGVIWIEDGHYNGNKSDTQGNHTFFWDNVGFDGPIVPQDRAFDVLDNQGGGNCGGCISLGWHMVYGGSQRLMTLPIDSASLTNAQGALLTFNWQTDTGVDLFHIGVNGHTYDVAPPANESDPYLTHTLALPINLSDVVTGLNAVTFTAGQYTLSVSSVDVILQGAGGSGGVTPTPTPTSTPLPVPSPTPAPVPIHNVPCVVTLNGVQERGTCDGTFTP